MATEQPTPTGAENPGEGTQPPADAGNAGGQQPTVKTYTQEEVNRITSERAAREKAKLPQLVKEEAAKAINAWREENGLTDEALSKLHGADKATSDLLAAQREAARLKKENESLQSRFEKAHGLLVGDRTRAAVLAEAASVSVDPESVYLHVKDRLKVEDDYTVTVLGDDGQPAHGSSIADLVGNLLKKKVHLAKPTGQQGSGSRPGGGGQAPQGPDLKTREGRNAALRSVSWD